MDLDKRDAAVGAFVVGAILAGALAVVAINRERFIAGVYHVEIDLPNIEGIDKSVEVLHEGYKAGMVDKVALAYEPDLRFKVRLAIKNGIQLRAGTSVIVRDKGFGGTKVLDLSVPKGGDNRALLKDGAVLPVVREPDLMAHANAVLGALDRIVQEFGKEGASANVARTFTRANAALARLDSTLTTLNAVMAENRAALKETIRDARGAAATTDEILTRKQEALERSLSALNDSLSHLPAIMVNIEEATAEIKREPWRLLRKGKSREPPVILDHRHEADVPRSTPTAAGERK